MVIKMKIFNKKDNKKLRQELRNSRSISEKLLWQKIRDSNLGHKFRRQQGIGDYIVDFYCPEFKLVIEIDGATHSTDNEIKYDEEREKYLRNLGLNIKRYRNVDVKDNIEGVLDDLISFIKEINPL